MRAIQKLSASVVRAPERRCDVPPLSAGSARLQSHAALSTMLQEAKSHKEIDNLHRIHSRDLSA
ncbi:hypothetical protein OCAR_6739 [Afipia carboxidovorans OM5]|nr:hypothetical protein OCAR_6739 [Afipia carboxidovorans OM5]